MADGDELGYEDHTKRPFSDVFKPIIAAVNGYCIAGGLEFLQGTDLRIAAEHATFGLGEVRWGIIPTGGSHIRLPRQIPWAVAMELLLMGRPIDAKRAYDIGLVNAVVPGDRRPADRDQVGRDDLQERSARGEDGEGDRRPRARARRPASCSRRRSARASSRRPTPRKGRRRSRRSARRVSRGASATSANARAVGPWRCETALARPVEPTPFQRSGSPTQLAVLCSNLAMIVTSGRNGSRSAAFARDGSRKPRTVSGPARVPPPKMKALPPRSSAPGSPVVAAPARH